MNKVIMITTLLLGLNFVQADAQVLGKGAISKILSKQLEDKLPELINGFSNVEKFQIDNIRIKRKGKVKIKGKFAVKPVNAMLNDEPFRFKSQFSLNLKNLGVDCVKVHIPGDKFLGIKRYRTII